MPRNHGALTRAGKVRKQTPKVAPNERITKAPKGRARKRNVFKRRYVNVDPINMKKGPNWHAGRKELMVQ